MFTKAVFGRQHRALGLTVVVAMVIAASISAVHAQSNSTSSKHVVLDPGTVIPVILNTELSSNGSFKGDTFTAAVDSSKQAYDNIMQGATVDGVIQDVTPKQGNQPGMLDLAFTNLRLADGTSYPISGSLTSLDSQNLSVGSDGILKAKSTSQNLRLNYAGIGAGAGALVGLLGHGKLKIEDIILGGLAGYGVGSIVKSPVQVHDVDLKPGTPMGVLLGSRVGYYHRINQSGAYQPANSSSGFKYYWYQGQEWTMNLATGERRPVPGSIQTSPMTGRKYYSFQGHHYFFDPATGERVQID